MAYLDIDDKLQGADPQSQGGAASPLVGADTTAVGQGVSTAGVGAGGTGGWTNIQAYLSANQGNSGTANALKSEADKTFGDEESKLNSEVDSYKTSAQRQARPADTDVSSYIGKASQGDSEASSIMKNYLSSQYQRPQKSFAYGLGSQSQGLGQAQTEDGYKTLVDDFYNRAAGGQMTEGQRDLQHQLDVNNPAMEQTRQSMAGRYKALENMAGLKVGEANQFASDQASGFSQDQDSLRSYLGQEGKSILDKYNEIGAGANEAKIGDQRSQLRKRYNTIQGWLGGQPIADMTPPVGIPKPAQPADHAPEAAPVPDATPAPEAAPTNQLKGDVFEGINARDYTSTNPESNKRVGNKKGISIGSRNAMINYLNPDPILTPENERWKNDNYYDPNYVG